MRGIDLYSGVGGWALGLKLAGIETVASFEWWDEAAETYETNLGLKPNLSNIRELDLNALPHHIDLVVGSPPCTQFSFSNRGGNGDIQDGLKDVAKFLEVVEHLQPHYWVMENVPRVAAILEEETKIGGSLARFAPLISVVRVFDMSQFGLPQARKRMLAGHFPVDLLDSYSRTLPRRTLGEVVEALSRSEVTDPLYSVRLRRCELTHNEREDALTPEEIRMNREAKQYHPVYNKMSFPDELERPSRTITATCTRVSRESIVIADDRGRRAFRRLSLRERASLQGFPVTFQFYGRSYGSRLKMAGNAIPPLFVYYVAQSILGTPATRLKPPNPKRLPKLPSTLPPPVKLEAGPTRYPLTRRFRAAIPHLRFGSGVRFELVNDLRGKTPLWRIAFYYGTSKDIKSVELNEALLRSLTESRLCGLKTVVRETGAFIRQEFSNVNAARVQESWTRKGDGVHPHKIVDLLGKKAAALMSVFNGDRLVEAQDAVAATLGMTGERAGTNGRAKMDANAPALLAGFIVGSCFNAYSGLSEDERRRY